ncbi:hypothetical protein Q8F55_004764 [Vanrija albida]|uniref:Uncharacterized protein n=1 Tax=Vanrija albida TaxID=181172 RepID=A0ABR3Q030_9TREE
MLLGSLLTLISALTVAASALPGAVDDFGLTHDGRNLDERGKPPTVSFNPRFPQQCGEVTVSWTGKPPFDLQLGNWRGPVETHSGFLAWEFHEGITQTSFTYRVPFPPGATFMAQIKTGDGKTIWRRATVLRGNKKCDTIETWSEGPPWPSNTWSDAPSSTPAVTPTNSPPGSEVIPTPSSQPPASSSAPPSTTTSSDQPLPTSPNLRINLMWNPTRCVPVRVVFGMGQPPYTLVWALQEGPRVINNADPEDGYHMWPVDTRSKFLAAYLYDSAGNYGILNPIDIYGNDTSCIKG